MHFAAQAHLDLRDADTILAGYDDMTMRGTYGTVNRIAAGYEAKGS